MEKNICSIVRWHLKLFRICCCSPISLSAKPSVAQIEKYFWPSWNILIIVIFDIVSLALIKYHDYFPHNNDEFGTAIDIIKHGVTALAMQAYTLEPLFQIKDERKFWEQYIRLSSTRQLVSASFWTQVKEYKWFLIKFYGFFVANQCVDLFVLLQLDEFTPLVLFFSTVLYPLVYFIKFRTLHMMFCLDLLIVEFNALERDLALLVEYTEYGLYRATFPRFNEFVRLRIVEKQRVYEQIFSMLEYFKKANGLSIITNYFKYYTRLLVSLYWFYWNCYSSSLTIQDILLIPAILEIPMFLLTAKSCMTAAKYIQYRVHNLKHSPDNIATSVQIQNFSLQLLHQQIKIDGLGIASMDGYMLTRAVGSITTYMVFFIQFMPKFKSKFD